MDRCRETVTRRRLGARALEGAKGRLNVGKRFFSLCVLFLLFKALTLRVGFGERRRGRIFHSLEILINMLDLTIEEFSMHQAASAEALVY